MTGALYTGSLFLSLIFIQYINAASIEPSEIIAKEAVQVAFNLGREKLENLKNEFHKFKVDGIDKIGNSANDQRQRLTRLKKEGDSKREKAVIIIEATKELAKMTGMSVKELVESEFGQIWHEDCDEEEIVCDEDQVYRTADGTCNNLCHPSWGSTFTSQARWLPAAYDDGINHQRTIAKSGDPLPSARAISNALFDDSNTNANQGDRKHTVMTFAWGQFIDHDITLTPVTPGEGGTTVTCCGDDVKGREPCFPIKVSNDPFFIGKTCMEFVRSAPSPPSDCGPGVREQMNVLNAFFDAEAVYGSTEEQMMSLRTGKEGLMATRDPNLLPEGGTCEKVVIDDYCPRAGDRRVNVFPTLGELHLLFVREHNRIAQILSSNHPEWNDETIFQEARKIISALIQHITYGEYLPIILDKDTRKRENLDLKSSGYSRRYKTKTNPSIKNAFSTAAFRFGHSQIPSVIAHLLQDYKTYYPELSEDTFFKPHMVIADHGAKTSDLARFIVFNSTKLVDRFFVDAVRNKLFQRPDGHSLDLVALNIQRGRDHGLPPYNEWRRFCGLQVARNFDALTNHTKRVKKALKGIYDHVDDIDLFVGGMTEKHVKGAIVGPVFSCLLSKQFRDLKEGDRFWYEYEGPQGFTPEQLNEIRKVKLSKVHCDNFNLDEIQPNAFKVASKRNKMIACDKLPSMDLTKW